jgi:hypothetical protein
MLRKYEGDEASDDPVRGSLHLKEEANGDSRAEGTGEERSH